MKTQAIAVTRLRKDARFIAYLCAACALIGVVEAHSAAPVHDWIAGPIFFGTFAGIVVALLQRGAGRLRELELIEQSAPLFGRELARATAVVPCVTMVVALAAYWAAQFVAGFAPPLSLFVLCAAAVVAATLVAMSATLRRGAARYLYVVLACAVAVIAYVLIAYVNVLRGVWELAFCALIVFIALRQYGEALARYDPIPE